MKIKNFLDQQTAVVKVKSVMTPLLILTGISAGLLLALAFVPSNIVIPEWLIITLICTLISPIPIFILVYLYFVLKDPDRLHSEHYLLNRSLIENHYMSDQKNGVLEFIPDNYLVQDIKEDTLLVTSEENGN